MASYSWNFGDGNTSSEIAPTHVYSTPGTYEGSLTVDFGSHVSTTYFIVNVFSDGDIFWDFGDGTGTSSPVAEHTYTEPGKFNARGLSWAGDVQFEQEITVNGEIDYTSGRIYNALTLLIAQFRGSERSFPINTIRTSSNNSGIQMQENVILLNRTQSAIFLLLSQFKNGFVPW